MGSDLVKWNYGLDIIKFSSQFFKIKVPVEDGGLLPGRKLVPRELVDNFWNHKHPRVGIDHMDELNPDCWWIASQKMLRIKCIKCVSKLRMYVIAMLICKKKEK